MLALYFRLIGARIRSQMQYKLSFWLETIGFALITGSEFAVLYILLNRFQNVAGWTVAEIALMYGFGSVAFSFAEMIARGFDFPFATMMRDGSFDKILTRPLGSFFQVLASEFQLRRLGRTFQGALALSYACTTLPIVWTPAKLLLVPVTLFAGILVYTGVVVISGTLCFWTIQQPEVINVFTGGGQYLSSYPLTIYNEWIRAIFLFVVPVAFVSYPAALFLLGRSDPNGLPAAAAWASPLVGVLFLSLALGFWRIGVSKYQSTGS